MLNHLVNLISQSKKKKKKKIGEFNHLKKYSTNLLQLKDSMLNHCFCSTMNFPLLMLDFACDFKCLEVG